MCFRIVLAYLKGTPFDSTVEQSSEPVLCVIQSMQLSAESDGTYIARNGRCCLMATLLTTLACPLISPVTVYLVIRYSGDGNAICSREGMTDQLESPY